MQEFDEILDAFKLGDSIFIPGASAEPRALVEVIATHSNNLPELDITNTFLPGINTVELAAFGNALNEQVFFPRGDKLFDTDRIQFTRRSWLQAYQYLQQQTFDWLVVHVSTPDVNGDCSLGASVEFLPMLLHSSKKVIGVINSRMPAPPCSPMVNLSKFDLTVEVDYPLVAYKTSEPDAVTKRIAVNLSQLVDDDSILQIGLGNVPDQFVRSLHDRKNLRFESGMLSDSFLMLHEAGALDSAFQHRCTLTLGSESFYQRLPSIPNLQLVGVDTSHASVSALEAGRFTAINSALQVSLDGRANLEFIGTRRVSNVGGALDFAKRTSIDREAKNIISLPATASAGKFSRIVSAFDSEGHDSLGQYGIDYIVTEFGIARIGNLSGRARAEEIIKIAAPKFREKLASEYTNNSIEE